MYAILVGGGKVGRQLATELVADGIIVAVIEKDNNKCEQIASSLNTLVINGDGADFSVLESAGANKADFAIAVTGSDEVNFVVCQLAKITFKVKIALARINDPRNESIFNKLGIDFTFTTTNIIAKMMHETIQCKECGLPYVIPEFINRRSKFEIIRFVIRDQSPANHQSFRDLPLPEGTLAIALSRDGETMIPSGKIVLKTNDIVYFTLRKDLHGSLRKVILGAEE
jgi:trk system potassium uptake protein TrkA